MVDVDLVKPTLENIAHIAANMRKEDVDEVWSSHNHTPIDALTKSWSISDHGVVVVINGFPCAIVALVIKDILTGTGTPWMLGTKDSLNYKREFFNQSPLIISEMLNICPNLFNYVHVNNKMSVKWLKWLGFEMQEPERYGVENEYFHRFSMQRGVN